MIKQLAHLCIHSLDLEKTRWFYCDVLGAEVTFDFDKNGSLFGYYFKLGGSTFLEVFQGEPGDANGNIKHICLEVEDIDCVVAALKENGVEVTDKKLGGDHSWQAWTADPNGVRIEFHQYTKESMQLVGGTCPVTW
ncbi:MAG: VOC family protein [Candidatus Latescibacteria bacterium]|nr:VOC family protein [Candidatus Latescibacterota bacterium]